MGPLQVEIKIEDVQFSLGAPNGQRLLWAHSGRVRFAARSCTQEQLAIEWRSDVLLCSAPQTPKSSDGNVDADGDGTSPRAEILPVLPCVRRCVRV